MMQSASSPKAPPGAPSNAGRRLALKFAATAAAAQAMTACGGEVRADALSGNASAAVNAAVGRFAALSPAGTNCLVHVDAPGGAWSAASTPHRQLFVGSATKTFMLAQFLKDAEMDRNGVTGNSPALISDAVRTVGSPVFGDLNGTLPFRSALEAMIAHSDNTATDMTLASVTADRVRQLIAAAGLTRTQIPDSTRRFFSYLAGEPYGTDVPWSRLVSVLDNPSTPRPAVNDRESMLSSATDLVNWYRQALKGAFFTQPGTLTEFKRIQAMANAIPFVVPPDIAAYAKGGSLDWQDTHAVCLAGQMVVDRVPVTFCFTYNWTGKELSTGAPFRAFLQASNAVLQACVDAIRTVS